MTTASRLDQISEFLNSAHLPKYRFAQIKTAIYSSNFNRYSQISNLPTDVRTQLTKELGDDILSLVKITEIEGDHAHKVLFHTRDGRPVESVRLSYHDHTALCVSTQSGCALGCAFCATGRLGFLKNLTADEIVDQILYFIKAGHNIDRIIFMGMGEPFSNPENTFAALADITDKDKLAMSPYRLSVSTVGIVPGIERLTREFPAVNLAFSLHSPFNDQRKSLMPITNAYPIEKVLSAIDRHLTATNHKVFVSYILLDAVNDTPDHAQALADLIKSSTDRLRLFHVNLIRYNQTEADFNKSTPAKIKAFQDVLNRNRVKNTLRQDFGVNIKAACGQLAAYTG